MRKYYFLILLFVALFSFSCRHYDIIPRSKFTDILFDVHLTKSLLEKNRASEWNKTRLPEKYISDLSYEYVLKKYNVTSDEFFKSVAYYCDNLDDYSNIYGTLEKKMDKFISDIENWHYHRQSAEDLYTSFREDSLRISILYHKSLLNPELKDSLEFVFIADTFKTYSNWLSEQWLKEYNNENGKFKTVPDSIIIQPDTSTVSCNGRLKDTVSITKSDHF